MAEEKKFGVVDFLLNSALYDKQDLNGDSRTGIKFLKFECFCDICQKDKPFVFYDIINYPLERDRELEPFLLLRGSVPAEFILQFECNNCGGLISYALKCEDGKLFKIGQYPPFNILKKNEMSKYRIEMPEFFKEYTDALNIFSTGSFVASFLLLRRLFSNLLDIDYRKYFPSGKDRSMTEKVRSLENDKHFVFPPEFDKLKIRILSELDKDITAYVDTECKENFPALKVCIEYLADKHTEEKRRASRLREAVRSLKE